MTGFCWLLFCLRIGYIFVVLCISQNFILYLGHYNCYAVGRLISIFVLIGINLLGLICNVSPVNDGRSNRSFLLALVATCFELALPICVSGITCHHGQCSFIEFWILHLLPLLPKTPCVGHVCPSLHVLIPQAKNMEVFYWSFSHPTMFWDCNSDQITKKEIHPVLVPFFKFLFPSNNCLILFILQNLKVIAFCFLASVYRG